MPEPAQTSAGQSAAGGAAAGAMPGAVAAGGLAGAGALAPGVPVTAGAIVAALVTFLMTLRRTHEMWLRQHLGRYGQRTDIDQAIADEMRFEELFAANSADRLSAALPAALAIADPEQRVARIRQLLADEQRYAQQRSAAMVARAIAAVTRYALRRTSPQGAYWKLGHAVQHTHGCLLMADKFWPWEVLNRVHPPRHRGCTSSLHGFGEAILNGWMSPGDVPDLRSAIRLAAGVMMEGEAGALLAELDVRDRLIDAGVDRAALDSIPLEGLREAFDDARHPRDRRGRFAAEAAAVLKRGIAAAIDPKHAPELINALADGRPSSLHLLTVSGHPNLFGAHARELSRAEMPQVPKEHLAGFMDFLRGKRVLATVEDVSPSDLQATQNQINGAAVAALAKGWDPQKGGMMLISRDGHVLDGHHRWAAAALHQMSNPSYRVQALRFAASTGDMLAWMHEYNARVGVRARGFGEGRVPKGGEEWRAA